LGNYKEISMTEHLQNYRTLDRETIERTIRETNSNAQAARFLGIHVNSWKKYASYYTDPTTGKTLYELHNNKFGLGTTDKVLKGRKTRATIYDVVEGIVPAKSFRPGDLKAMIVKEGLLESRCACCGFNEARITDGKVPLMITFRNMDRRNWSIDNLQLLCLNCYFLQIGDVLTRQQHAYLQYAMTEDKTNVRDVLDLDSTDMKTLEAIWRGEYETNDLSGDDLISRGG